MLLNCQLKRLNKINNYSRNDNKIILTGTYVTDDGIINHNLNGNGYTISGGNGGKIFFRFNKASGKIENVTFKDFKSLKNSGGFFISSGSKIELDKVTFNNISNPLDGGHETSWGGALNVDANSQNIKISNSNFIEEI